MIAAGLWNALCTICRRLWKRRKSNGVINVDKCDVTNMTKNMTDLSNSEPIVDEKVDLQPRKPSPVIQFKPYRISRVYDDFPHAPKKQPCPNCRKWVKRTKRSKTRAEYYCKKDNVVLVLSLRQR